MKRLLLAFVFCYSFLYGLQVGVSSFINGVNTDSEAIEYQACSYCRLDSVCALELTYGRSIGGDYREVEAFVWKYFKTVRLTVKYLDRTRHDLQVFGADVRGHYSGLSVGVAQTWDMRPSTSLVAGYEYRRNLGVKFLMPVSVFFSTSLYTTDLRRFNTESDIRFTMRVTSLLGVQFAFKQRYYDYFEYTTSLGIEAEI